MESVLIFVTIFFILLFFVKVRGWKLWIVCAGYYVMCYWPSMLNIMWLLLVYAACIDIGRFVSKRAAHKYGSVIGQPLTVD